MHTQKSGHRLEAEAVLAKLNEIEKTNLKSVQHGIPFAVTRALLSFCAAQACRSELDCGDLSPLLIESEKKAATSRSTPI
jgi:hypothetical protein